MALRMREVWTMGSHRISLGGGAEEQSADVGHLQAWTGNQMG